MKMHLCDGLNIAAKKHHLLNRKIIMTTLVMTEVYHVWVCVCVCARLCLNVTYDRQCCVQTVCGRAESRDCQF